MDSGTESEDDELGSNLNMDNKDHFMYNSKPSMRWYSYCGIYNSCNGLMQCNFPECGRKICKPSVMSKHHRHQKNLPKCTNWIPWLMRLSGSCKRDMGWGVNHMDENICGAASHVPEYGQSVWFNYFLFTSQRFILL